MNGVPRYQYGLLFVACFSLIGLAVPPAIGSEADDAFLQAKPGDMKWFREAKFGLFIHWGPVSLKGTEIGWSRGGERRGRNDQSTGSIPVDVYDNLYKEFNPTEFDAEEWVAIAKDAGMQYLVFTSKHHDGFCMFDTKTTDYKIGNSPFKRDVVKELADACHKAGLRLGFYYSPPDWQHKWYRGDEHAKYVEYMHEHVRELCTNYGKLDIMWFDGLGGTAEDWNSRPLFRMIRTLQPGILINNRAGLPGDFGTPEQRVGGFDNSRAWESCITICRQWAWKPDDKMKTLEECLHTLITCAGGDGNLLFNVGPMPTGEIEGRQVDRLREMGEWLDEYGESIYSTRGGPFVPGDWGASTYRGNVVYVHILDPERDTVILPPVDKNIVSYRALTGEAVGVRQTHKEIEITIPTAGRQEIDTIVVLQLDGPAAGIKPLKPFWDSFTIDKKATSSNVYQNHSEFSADKAVDGNTGTRWATNSGTKRAWLAVDLGKTQRFDRAVIQEAYDRVRAYELHVKDGGDWKTIHTGQRIGKNLEVRFSPVAARHVRLNILEATDGPTVWEFHVFAPTAD